MWKTIAGIGVVLCALSASRAVGAVEVWCDSSTVKIFQDAAPAPGAAAAPMTIAGARREVAAGQIVLKSDGDLGDITLRATDLAGTGTIPLSAVSLWREHYIPAGAKAWPDALSPLAATTRLELKKSVAQPIFVEIAIPAGARPGLHRGQLTVARGHDEQLATVNIELNVYDFELPATLSLRTAFGNDDNSIRAMEQPATEADFQKLRKAYYEMLLSHAVSPYTIPADLDKPKQSDAYLNDPRMTSFKIPYLENDDAALKRLCDRLRANGSFGKGYFYEVDEPRRPEAFDQLVKTAERLKRVVGPDYKLVSPYCDNPHVKSDKDVYDLLEGNVSIWCYLTTMHKYATHKLDARRARGEEIWNYVCCAPDPPMANYWIDLPAIRHRILPWQNWQYQTTGLLYWCANYWSNNADGTTDPWTDSATAKFVRKDLYGDGSLLYPGRKMNHDGPLPSLRLKVIRQSLQDYEYLSLAAKRAGRETVDAIVKDVTRDWSDYAQDPRELDAARERLAAIIGATHPE